MEKSDCMTAVGGGAPGGRPAVVAITLFSILGGFKLSSRCLTRVFCHSYAVNELSPLCFCLVGGVTHKSNSSLLARVESSAKKHKLNKMSSLCAEKKNSMYYFRKAS